MTVQITRLPPGPVDPALEFDATPLDEAMSSWKRTPSAPAKKRGRPARQEKTMKKMNPAEARADLMARLLKEGVTKAKAVELLAAFDTPEERLERTRRAFEAMARAHYSRQGS